MNLKRQVFVGSLWSLFGNGGQQLIGFFLFIYIARRLTPADVGLVALAMVLIEILSFASRFGQVEVLQRHPELSDRSISTAFWLLVVAGAVTMSLVAGASRLADGWSDSSSFSTVLLLLAPMCALQAWNAVPEALLRRRFDFRSLGVRNWLATLSGGVVGVFLAYRGYGVYSLVAQRLITSFVQTIATWAFLRWHPRWEFDWGEAKRLAGMGSQIMLAGFAGVLNLRIADALTGTMVGPTPLGYLRLGWRFFDVIVQLSVYPVTNVALATFSRMQKDLEALRRAYLRLTQFMAVASLPLFFGLAAIADIFVPVVFGEKWRGSIVVLELLCLVILPGTVNFFFGPVMIAVGQARLVLWQSTVQVAMTAVFMFVGARYGVVGVMGAYIARAILVAAYNLHAMSRVLGLSVPAVLRTLAPPAVSCGIMAIFVLVMKTAIRDSLPDIATLVVLVLWGALVYGAALLLGDVVGFWRGYVRSAAGSLAGAMSRRPANQPA